MKGELTNLEHLFFCFFFITTTNLLLSFIFLPIIMLYFYVIFMFVIGPCLLHKHHIILNNRLMKLSYNNVKYECPLEINT